MKIIEYKTKHTKGKKIQTQIFASVVNQSTPKSNETYIRSYHRLDLESPKILTKLFPFMIYMSTKCQLSVYKSKIICSFD